MCDANVRARDFVFTLNNYTIEEVNELMRSKFKFLCFGFEIAPTTGTPHLQGYVEFKDARSRSAVSKEPCFARARLDKRRANDRMDTIRYCAKELGKNLRLFIHNRNVHIHEGKMKGFEQRIKYEDLDDHEIIEWMKTDNSWIEALHGSDWFKGFGCDDHFKFYGYLLGDPAKKKRQGKRNDIAEAKRIILEGGTVWDVLNETNSVQAIRIAEKMIEYQPMSLRKFPKNITWFYGESGAGKSETARLTIVELCGGDEDNLKNLYWRTKKDGLWFSGYQGQKFVLLDEVRASRWEYEDLLNLFDQLDYEVGTKGAFTKWRPTHIYVTSRKSPAETYRTKSDKNIYQLLRRINTVVEFKGKFIENNVTETIKTTEELIQERRHVKKKRNPYMILETRVTDSTNESTSTTAGITASVRNPDYVPRAKINIIDN